MSASVTALTITRLARRLGALCGITALGVLAGCSTAGPDEPRLDAGAGTGARANANETEAAALLAPAATESTPQDAPPPAIRAWMERLTVSHHYDPATGFIVADEVVPLPAVLRRAPDARTLVAFGQEHGLPVVVFATADRCAPCQQYKRDALRDPEVLVFLESGDIMATHVEVDEAPDLAREVLGSTSIPMTYLIRDGRVVDRLAGQRSAAELRDWLRRAMG